MAKKTLIAIGGDYLEKDIDKEIKLWNYYGFYGQLPSGFIGFSCIVLNGNSK